MKLGGDEGRYIKFAMLTGKRHEQPDQADELEQIDASGFSNVPAERGNKVKRAHPVAPLSALALRVLGPRKERPGLPHSRRTSAPGPRSQADGSLTGGGGPFHLARSKTLDEISAGRVPGVLDIADMLLDHAPRRGTGRIYNHSTALDYRDPAQPAAEAWAGYIAKLVQPAEEAG